MRTYETWIEEELPTGGKRSRLTYRKTTWAMLRHVWWDTQPSQKYGMVEETWRLGPFELLRRYPREDKSYGNWTFSFALALRRWRGPWLLFSFGTGAQNWDPEDD